MASTVRSHRADPGSIPGIGVYLFLDLRCDDVFYKPLQQKYFTWSALRRNSSQKDKHRFLFSQRNLGYDNDTWIVDCEPHVKENSQFNLTEYLSVHYLVKSFSTKLMICPNFESFSYQCLTRKRVKATIFFFILVKQAVDLISYSITRLLLAH